MPKTSVYIKDMEMPKHGCDHCFLRTGNYCGRIEKDEYVVEYARRNERHPDCPLVLVPTHGALIDRAELWVEINKICDRRDAGIITDLMCLQQILSALRHAPTIIPAEEES